jgi:hypothetical protein
LPIPDLRPFCCLINLLTNSLSSALFCAFNIP